MLGLGRAELYENQEFQSAMVRLGIWGFAVIYVSAGALLNRYDLDVNAVFIFFAVYLLIFVAILVSVFIRPEWGERRYFSLVVDISATTVCIYLTGEADSPFFILYVWIFVSYGTRYGKQHLKIASIMSILTYSAVFIVLGQWKEYLLEATFILLALAVLPVYQYSLMRQLQKARSEAERSNRMVGRFLSNMTNEMRGPLVDILGTTKDLSEQQLTAGQLDKIDDINSSASILDSVIGDVLDFYKLESNQMHLETTPFNIYALMSEVCSSVVKQVLVKQKELVCSIASGVPEIIVGDEQRLRQVLTNILRSSINCCLGDDVQIKVKIDSSNLEMLLFEVKGIAPLFSSKLEGYSSDVAVLDGQSGMDLDINPDLGNSFASKLVSLMGGEFGFGPREDGVIYWFRFPAKTDDFEVGQVSKLPGLKDKKVFVFEPNGVSRNEIVRCCTEQGMSVDAVNKVGELSDVISGLKKSEEIDLVLIADSPAGRDVERIADVCHDVLGSDLPLLVLSYKRNCIDMAAYDSVVMLRKPFIQSQLTEGMEKALACH
jgi:two-component system sensor histidine kinase RpfC